MKNVELLPGQLVWVAGWPKSKTARYVLKAVRQDGSVDVWREHRGKGALRTVTADRIGYRRPMIGDQRG